MRWAVVVLMGCSSGAAGKLALSWQFADGRPCPDTGAASMAVRAGDTGAKTFGCAEGVPPQAVMLEGVPADGVTVTVQALSTEMAALYSGALELDALPSAATVTLYADKMR
jgi:hypothetical protein